MMSFLEAYRPILMVATFALLGGAFYLTYRPRPQSSGSARSSIMTFNKIMLWVAAMAAVVMFFFPQVPSLFESGNRFTADMQKTYFQIEGMT